MIWIGLLFCTPMSGNERDDIQFVSRKLKQIAEQLPEGTLSSVDTIMEIPVIIEGKSIVMQHNDKGQVCHLGVSLFSEATKQILDVGLCNFLESIIRKSKFPQNPKRSVRFSGKGTKRSVQKRKARNTQKAETKVL